MVLDWTKKDFPVLNLSFWPMFKINLNQQKDEASVMYTFWTMPILMFSPVSTFGDQSLVISLLPYQISGIYWIILLSTNAFIHQSSCLLFISIFLTKFPLEISMKCNITHPIHATLRTVPGYPGIYFLRQHVYMNCITIESGVISSTGEKNHSIA